MNQQVDQPRKKRKKTNNAMKFETDIAFFFLCIVIVRVYLYVSLFDENKNI